MFKVLRLLVLVCLCIVLATLEGVAASEPNTSYANQDIEGTWTLRSLGTQKNGQADNFGYDLGTFTYEADGFFAGTMTDDEGDSWSESGTSTLNTDGTVNLWVGEGLTYPAAMNARKDVIIANYQDENEFALDIFVKQGTDYKTSDLEGTWYFRGLCTQKNGQADNFGYDLGTFTYEADGFFTGTMTDDEDDSWSESGTSTVNADGTVNLWVGEGLTFPAVMNAGKDVIVANYQDENEFCLDIFIKKYVASSVPPSAPTMSYDVDGTSITITWNAVTDSTGYVLRYGVGADASPASFMSLDLGNQTSFSYDALVEGMTYKIAVQAYNEVGDSDLSNIETFTVAASEPPSAPAMSCNVDGTSLSVTWDTVADATGYTLRYGVGADASP